LPPSENESASSHILARLSEKEDQGNAPTGCHMVVGEMAITSEALSPHPPKDQGVAAREVRGAPFSSTSVLAINTGAARCVEEENIRDRGGAQAPYGACRCARVRHAAARRPARAGFVPRLRQPSMLSALRGVASCRVPPPLDALLHASLREHCPNKAAERQEVIYWQVRRRGKEQRPESSSSLT